MAKRFTRNIRDSEINSKNHEPLDSLLQNDFVSDTKDVYIKNQQKFSPITGLLSGLEIKGAAQSLLKVDKKEILDGANSQILRHVATLEFDQNSLDSMIDEKVRAVLDDLLGEDPSVPPPAPGTDGYSEEDIRRLAKDETEKYFSEGLGSHEIYLQVETALDAQLPPLIEEKVKVTIAQELDKIKNNLRQFVQIDVEDYLDQNLEQQIIEAVEPLVSSLVFQEIQTQLDAELTLRLSQILPSYTYTKEEIDEKIIKALEGFEGGGGAGVPGEKGEKGDPGKSAYEIAQDRGFEGSVDDWLMTLIGKEGEKGAKGEKGEKGERGEKGLKGDRGDRGFTGPTGKEGKSAYEVAVANGFSGTEKQWLDSLKASAPSGNFVKFGTNQYLGYNPYMRERTTSSGNYLTFKNNNDTTAGVIGFLSNSMHLNIENRRMNGVLRLIDNIDTGTYNGRQLATITYGTSAPSSLRPGEIYLRY